MTEKSSEDWANEYTDRIVVYDPDGWDRRNFQVSWYDELITQEEFLRRAGRSTCFYTPKYLKFLKEPE